ncbi:MAG: VWA domain-containing protein [Thermodesulfobacteriota bacterium]|nr:VWA domain-containing protein [Thermodesulfobacteriota bacterium]
MEPSLREQKTGDLHFGHEKPDIHVLVSKLGGKRTPGKYGDHIHRLIERKLRAFESRMPGDLRQAGLHLVSTMVHDEPEKAQSLLDWLPELLSILPPEARQSSLKQADSIACQSGIASYNFLSHIIFLNKTLGPSRLVSWVDQGLCLLKRNVYAGQAYFDLHLRSAKDGLLQGDFAVSLDEVRGPLQLYINGISGRCLSVKSTEEGLSGSLSSSPWIFPFSDSENVYLPPFVQSFSTYEENYFFYRMLAAHQAGYYQSHTFGFSLVHFIAKKAQHLILKWWKPQFNKRDLHGNFFSHLQAFFHLFKYPELVRIIFTIVEDGRVDAHLRHNYPGLKKDIQPYINDIISQRPTWWNLQFPQAFMELLVQLSLDPERKFDVPFTYLKPLYYFISQRMKCSFHPQATVFDAALVATELYWVFFRFLKNQHELKAEGWINALFGCSEESFSKAGEISNELFQGSAYEESGLSSEGLDFLENLDLCCELRGNTDLGHMQKGFQMADYLQHVYDNDQNEVEYMLSLSNLEQLIESGIDGTAKDISPNTEFGSGIIFQDPHNQSFPPFPFCERQDQQVYSHDQRVSTLKSEYRKEFRERDTQIFFYEEWDYLMQDYRERWCRLLETVCKKTDREFVTKVRSDFASLIPLLRRQFELIRPEKSRKEKFLRDGEEIDFDKVIESLVDRRSGLTGTDRFYQQRMKIQRDVCTLFLLDMSSSTDQPVRSLLSEQKISPPAMEDDETVFDNLFRLSMNLSVLRTSLAPAVPCADKLNKGKRIIDVEKEALILMTEALETLGDRYAIYGFSGHGRMEVEFYIIKEFSEKSSDSVKERIGAIEPCGSTRMGTALRHCKHKFRNEEARRKNLFLISDGFPQDIDYGDDRKSHEYGIQDTACVLAELASEGVFTYCITVDRCGEDYLKRMCPESQYMVIQDIKSLPESLIKIYRKVTSLDPLY